MKDLFEIVPDLVWQKNAEGAYLQCNRALAQFFDLRKDGITGKTAYDLVSADLADALRVHDQTVINENRAVTSEEWLTSLRDGKRRRYETIRSPLTDDVGNVIGVFGIARDVSQRYEALNEAKFFRSLIENSSDPVFVLDPEDGARMIFVNDAACRHFGVSREELLAMRVPDWDPYVTPELLEQIQKQVDIGDSVIFETLHKRKPDGIVPVEVSANRMYHEGRKYNAGYIRDISKRKQAEEALKASQEQLRKLIGHQDHIRESERKQAAKELHDELAQHLLAIKIDLSLLPRNLGGSSFMVKTIEDIIERIDATIKSARTIMNNLRPSVLDLGLYAAFDWQAKEFGRKSGIACSLTGDEEELQLEERSATALFRIMQDVLGDIERHGQARQVAVSLQRRENDVVMQIANDGVLDAINSAGQAGHFGMVGIKERVTMLGGSAKVERNERGGAELSVSLPLWSQTQLPFS